MANGFLPYLLMQSADVFKSANPTTKITPPGFLSAMLDNTKPQILSRGIDNGDGTFRDVKIKYRPRLAPGKTRDTDDCSIDIMPSYLEETVSCGMFSALGIMLPDDTVARFEKEASAAKALGKPMTTVSMELFQIIMECANGLFADIDNALLTKMALNFGTNIVTGAATSQTVNFALDASVNNLATGMTKVLADMAENNINDAFMVGSGYINNYVMQQVAKGVDAAGVNSAALNFPKFYFDRNTASKFGANQFGVIEKNAVQLLNINQFAGFKGGDKLNTILGTMTLPVSGNGVDSLRDFQFDYQLKYIDCPTTVNVGGDPTSVTRGWFLQLMASYDLHVIPTDAYDATDPFTGNNGTLRYTATNL